MKYSLNPYSQPSDASQKTARSECSDRFPTEKGILMKGRVEELCMYFPNLDNVKMRAKIYNHILNDKLVIVPNQLPVISQVLALVVARDNQVNYMTISLKYGSC
jgi:hypothetical protein